MRSFPSLDRSKPVITSYIYLWHYYPTLTNIKHKQTHIIHTSSHHSSTKIPFMYLYTKNIYKISHVCESIRKRRKNRTFVPEDQTWAEMASTAVWTSADESTIKWAPLTPVVDVNTINLDKEEWFSQRKSYIKRERRIHNNLGDYSLLTTWQSARVNKKTEKMLGLSKKTKEKNKEKKYLLGLQQ